MFTGGPLQSVADARRRAQRRLPRAVAGAIAGGNGSGTLLQRNIEAFEELLLETRVGGSPSAPDTRTRVLDMDLSLPVLISPVGAQAVRPHAELAAARASARAGTGIGVSNFADTAIEDVVRENPKALAQLYWIGSREQLAERIARFREAGATGLILTIDWSGNSGVDWRSYPVIDRYRPSTIVRFAPQVVTRPAWLLDYLTTTGLPTLRCPNFTGSTWPTPRFAEVLGLLNSTPGPTWDDVAWVREQWGSDRPFVVKGILHPDDAERAEQSGATAISVSNHGGNDFDAETASVRALPAIAKRVGNRVEVLIDGGVRRGGDVVKALALGARAVLVGRPYLWSVAARGERGVGEMIEILRRGMIQAMRAIGAESVADIGPEHIQRAH